MDEVTTCALCHLASQNSFIQLISLVSCLFNTRLIMAIGDNLDQPDNHQFCIERIRLVGKILISSSWFDSPKPH